MDIDKLKDDVRFLGDILGQVIKEQEGEWLFDLEERIRKTSIKTNLENPDKLFESLNPLIENLSNKELELLVRSFTTYFHLVNLAENVHRTRRIHQYELDESYNRKNSLKALCHKVSDEGLVDEFNKLIQNVEITPTITAHPTEAKRKTILEKLQRIFDYMIKKERIEFSKLEMELLTNLIKTEITAMWKTDYVRERKISVLDEVKTGLFYLESILYPAIKDFYHKFNHIFSEIDFKQETPTPIKFSSWIGGDRDGHPFVTPDITQKTIKMHKKHILNLYYEEVKSLISILSLSSNKINLSQKFANNLALDLKRYNETNEENIIRNETEVFRSKLSLILEKIQNTFDNLDLSIKKQFYYQSPIELLKDIEIIKNELENNNSKALVKAYLEPFIYKIKVFGFYFAKLDIRQGSDIINQTAFEILEKSGIVMDLNSFEENKSSILEKEILSKRPVFYSDYQYSDVSLDLINTLKTVKWGLENIDENIFENFIISMCESENDILALLLLLKEFGLYNLSNNNERILKLNIVPLFETVNDLRNTRSILDSLFSCKSYQEALSSRNNFQEIMLGYSDSSKSGGILSSNWELYKAQLTIKEICEKYNIEFRMFHGRGGSISRGGGASSEAILSQPVGTIKGKIRITEQGEMLATKYGFREIALRTLEQSIYSICAADLFFKPTDLIENNNWFVAMEKLNQYSCEYYQEFVSRDSFIKNFQQFTPIDLISKLDIGSRPAKRKNTKSLNDLRAIPWVFSWMQTRLILTAWFGVGFALNKFVNEKEGNIDILKEMYQNWTYFSSLIKNIENVLGKSNIGIAKAYETLMVKNEESKDFINEIMNEFLITKKLVLEITSETELLEHQPKLSLSVKLRNPYIDPINFIQVNLLKKYRDLSDESPEKQEILHILRETVNGIAAGMKNTG